MKYKYKFDFINDRFRRLLADSTDYSVPRIIPELTTRRVLTSELIEGTPLDKCSTLDQDTRNDVRRTRARTWLHLHTLTIKIY